MVIAILVFVATLFALVPGEGHWDDYGVDEAHKVADTYFLRLVLEGKLHDPAWLRHIVDRTNPPAGKYLFGFAALASGSPIPPTLGIRVEKPEGDLGQRLRPPWGDELRPTLIADRWVSLIATALIAALVAYVSLLEHGLAASIVATLLYATSFLTVTFARMAVYDPLLTLFVTATIAPIALLWHRRRSRIITLLLALVAGSVGAAAFQIRLSGLTSTVATVAVLFVLWIRRRDRLLVVAMMTSFAVTLVVGTAINPYYWTTAHPADGVPPEFRTRTSLPSRIAHRYELQIQDLGLLLQREIRKNPPFTMRRKVRFSFEYLFGDWSGIFLLFGLLLAGLAWLPGGTARRDNLALLSVWSGSICVTLWLWLPLPWSRYLLPLIPPLAIVAGFGWGELLQQLVARIGDTAIGERLKLIPAGSRDRTATPPSLPGSGADR